MVLKILDQVGVFVEAFRDSSRIQKEVDREADKLALLWEKRQEAASKIALARADRLRKEGKLIGRPRLDKPTNLEGLKRRVASGSISETKLAKELGVSRPTLRGWLRDARGS